MINRKSVVEPSRLTVAVACAFFVISLLGALAIRNGFEKETVLLLAFCAGVLSPTLLSKFLPRSEGNALEIALREAQLSRERASEWMGISAIIAAQMVSGKTRSIAVGTEKTAVFQKITVSDVAVRDIQRYEEVLECVHG